MRTLAVEVPGGSSVIAAATGNGASTAHSSNDEVHRPCLGLGLGLGLDLSFALA